MSNSFLLLFSLKVRLFVPSSLPHRSLATQDNSQPETCFLSMVESIFACTLKHVARSEEVIFQ